MFWTNPITLMLAVLLVLPIAACDIISSGRVKLPEDPPPSNDCSTQTLLHDEMDGVATVPVPDDKGEKAQQITMASDEELYSFTTRISGAVGGESVTLDVIEGGSDPPTGTSIGSSTVIITGTSLETVTFLFTEPYPQLASGTVYFFEISADTGDTVNLEYSGSDAFDGEGQLWYRSGIIGTWIARPAGEDMNYQLTVCN